MSKILRIIVKSWIKWDIIKGMSNKIKNIIEKLVRYLINEKYGREGVGSMDYASNILAFAALIVSVSLYVRTKKNMELQEEHFKKCLQPFCNIRCVDLNHSIKIELYNVGLGYLKIENISIVNKLSQEDNISLYKIFPQNLKLSYYSVDIIGSGICSNQYITLMKIDNIKAQERKIIRSILKEYEIQIQYSDVYGIQYSTKKELHFLYGNKYRKSG